MQLVTFFTTAGWVLFPIVKRIRACRSSQAAICNRHKLHVNVRKMCGATTTLQFRDKNSILPWFVYHSMKLPIHRYEEGKDLKSNDSKPKVNNAIYKLILFQSGSHQGRGLVSYPEREVQTRACSCCPRQRPWLHKLLPTHSPLGQC